MPKINTYLDTCADGFFIMFISPLYLSRISLNSYSIALTGTDLKGYTRLYTWLFGI